MATSTGAPWNLPSPDLPEQPHGPAQIGDLAASVAAALGRAVPCTSLARPTPAPGMLAYETDTYTLLISPDGVGWRVLFSTPTVTGGGGLSPGTLERNDILTASTGWTVTSQRFYKVGGTVHHTCSIQRTGATLATNATNGNIVNVQIASIAAGWRPPLGNWQIAGGGSGGNFWAGYVGETGVYAVGWILPGTPANDWATGNIYTGGGSWPCGDG